MGRAFQIVVVGAGFAGAATAAALAERGVRGVLLVDGETVPGHHASGRNAAMARRVIADPVLTRLATDSVRGIRELDSRLVAPTGGLLFGDRADIDALWRAAQTVPELASSVQRWSIDQAANRYPVLAGASATDGLYSPGCGVVDIHGLLRTYLQRARRGGVEVRFGVRVNGVQRSHGRVTGVQLSDGTIPCERVVNAAGFAVNRIARAAGVRAIAASPFRRHLFVTATMAEVDPAWPFMWDVTRHLYLRPEGDGLLLCACDQTEWLPPRPDEPSSDPTERERMAERFSMHLPASSTARVRRQWAGLRVLTPDNRFVIGPDSELDGFFWVAGLGGHGMTTSHAVGAVAADALISGSVAPFYESAFAVDRLRASADGNHWSSAGHSPA